MQTKSRLRNGETRLEIASGAESQKAFSPASIVGHQRAAERAIAAMRERHDEPLTLDVLARIAYFSPFHFNRVFRRVTGLTPGRFLSAIRMQEAKRLLLTTDSSVTRISYQVGYNSLGTFSRLFTEFVGVQPIRLRRHADEVVEYCSTSLLDAIAERQKGGPGGLPTMITSDPEDSVGPLFAGVFREAIPRGRPITCSIAASPGEVVLAQVPDGVYHLFCAGLGEGGSPMDLLLNGPVFSAHSTFEVVDGSPIAPVEASLRRRIHLDPPMLLALPFIFSEHCAFS